MKSIAAGIGLILLGFLMFMFMPIMLPQAQDVLTATVTQTFADVETTSGTSATVTLTDEVYKDRVANVQSITGGEGDTPAPSSLSANGKTLVITGLATSATRALVVPYLVDNTTDFTGLGNTISFAPTLIMLAGLGIGIYGVWNSSKSRG